jgi:CheY-like chemotaxis protein
MEFVEWPRVDQDARARIDRLLVDVAMPGMSGIELVRRARVKHRRLRALFATGYATAKPVELGGDALLKKPYRFDTLA